MTRRIVSPEDELLGSENYDNCKRLLWGDMIVKSYGGHRLTEEIITKFVVPEIIYMTENMEVGPIYQLGNIDLDIDD